MIVKGLIPNVNNDLELENITGMNNNDFVYHVGNDSIYIYESRFGNGDIPSASGGFWVKETIKALNLEEYKLYRIEEIKQRTVELILQGFVYNNVLFKLDEDAQIGLLALYDTRNDPVITYPQPYGNKDDTVVYQIQSAQDLEGMYLTALGTKKHWLETEDVLKQQIQACTTYQEVQNIIDNR